jgi:hypothetical protein
MAFAYSNYMTAQAGKCSCISGIRAIHGRHEPFMLWAGALPSPTEV